MGIKGVPSLMGLFDPGHSRNVFSIGSNRLNSKDAFKRRKRFIESLSIADPSRFQAHLLGFLEDEEGFPGGQA